MRRIDGIGTRSSFGAVVRNEEGSQHWGELIGFAQPRCRHASLDQR